MSKQKYDIIGDIHGRWDKLEPMLDLLGYQNGKECYEHPEGRKIIFLGDLIDPKDVKVPNGTREVLACVKAMVDHGKALCILGNHEFNFVAYHSMDRGGNFVRPHSEKNAKMHAGTHVALSGVEIADTWLPFFKSLPFFIEMEDFRVVHACWHPGHIEFLRGKTLADNALLIESAKRGTKAYCAVETCLKGMEIALATPHSFRDHTGTERNRIRARWWDGKLKALRAKDLLFPPDASFDDCPIAPEAVTGLPGYEFSEKPLFIGHYYKAADADSAPETRNIYCLDFSAATDGPLTAYRFEETGEVKETNLRQISDPRG